MQSPAVPIACSLLRRNNDSGRIPHGDWQQMNANERKMASARPLSVGADQLVPWFYLCRSAFICGLFLVSAISAARGENWPGWRGPRGDGSSSETNMPIEWSGKDGAQRNITWKVEILGRGHASPIVWNDRVFVVTCDEERQERLLLCLDRETGETLWRGTVLRSPLEKKHVLNSFASSTPVTDGKRVYVTFLKTDGTEGQNPCAIAG